MAFTYEAPKTVFPMIFRILLAVVSVAVASVSCDGYEDEERRQSGNDPHLKFPIEHFMPFQKSDDYGFYAELSDLFNNEANNGGFQVPWEEGEKTGNVRSHWTTLFLRPFHTNGINDFSHHFHHSPEFHRTNSSTFPWRGRAETLKPSIISTTSTTESTTTPMQSKLPEIDIRFGVSSENDTE